MLVRADRRTRADRRMSDWQRFLIIDVNSGARDMPSLRALRSAARWLCMGRAGPGWYRLVP